MFCRLAQTLWLIAVISLPVLAQAQTVAPYPDQTTKVNILIDRQALRFLTSGDAVEWRLVISDRQGEVVYDSGLVNGAALEWPLVNQQGEAVAGGLYAYTLTVKGAPDEVGHTRSGHVIIDRPSAAARLWVTSDAEVSLGATAEAGKVSVIGGEKMSVGGAELPAVAARPKEGERQGRETKRATAQAKAKGDTPAAPAATAGTANRLAKFANDGATLIDSTVTETAAGDIGIGTSTPGGVFDLQRLNSSGDILQRLWNTTPGTNAAAGAKLRYVAATGATSQLQLTDNAEWLMALAGNNSIGMQFRVRNNSDPNTETGLNAAARMTIARNGNVGIGTTNPLRLLQLGSSLDAAFTFEPGGTPDAGYIRFGDNTGWKLHFARSREKSLANGGALNTGTTGVLMTIQDNGNVGIGTTTPAAALDVRGDVKLGKTGQLFAPGGEENLRIIRGYFDKGGNIDLGTGFTVSHPSAGTYNITFTTPFSAPPVITATCFLLNGEGCTVNFDKATIGGVQFYLAPSSTTGEINDATVNFIAIGPR